MEAEVKEESSVTLAANEIAEGKITIIEPNEIEEENVESNKENNNEEGE